MAMTEMLPLTEPISESDPAVKYVAGVTYEAPQTITVSRPIISITGIDQDATAQTTIVSTPTSVSKYVYFNTTVSPSAYNIGSGARINSLSADKKTVVVQGHSGSTTDFYIIY